MGDRSVFESPSNLHADVDRWCAAMAAFEPPVATVLVAAVPPTSPHGLVEEALRAAGVDQEPRRAWARRIAEVWRGAPAPTLAIGLSGEPRHDPAVLALPFTAPELAGREGARARYGVPWTAPVRMALRARPDAVVLYVDVARVRRFEFAGGRVRETSAAIRALDPSTWRPLREESVGPSGAHARGGAAVDHFAKREEAWTERFWKRVADDVASDLRAMPGGRAFASGSDRALAAFARAWPSAAPPLTTRPGALADPDAAEGAWADAIVRWMDEEARAGDAAALRAVEERGVAGPAACWTALREGRLATLLLPAGRAVPAAFEGALDAMHDVPDGLPDAVAGDGSVERVDLSDHVEPWLERHGTELRLLHGGHADELEGRYRGVAGVVLR
jgi:hypothetical protein